MTVEKDGLYDVTFAFQNHKTGETRSDGLIMYGVEIHAGEDVEEVCEDWLKEDVKDPQDWSVSRAVLQKKGGE
jgi:hypothetical protein